MSPSSDDANRRRADRLPLREPVRLRGDGRLSHSRGLAMNLSSTGLFVAADDPGQIGDRVRCELSCVPKTPIDVACRVVWVRHDDHPDGPPGMGLAFEDLTTSRSERIEGLIHRLRQQTSSSFVAVDRFAESGTWAPAEIFDDLPPPVVENTRPLKLALGLSLAVIAGLLAVIALLLLR